MEQIVKKSQLWSGFMVPSLAFLLGFFKDNLHAAAALLIPVGISWIFFIFAMELADYSEVNWHAILADLVYHLGAITLFLGLFVYFSGLPELTQLSWIFFIPFGFYLFMLVFSPIFNAITIYQAEYN